MAIINEHIEVVKSDLPEDWKPEAADFLVKLLIKNPELRLGRYGSFEIRNHPWLQNYTWTQSVTTSNISLVEDYFSEKKYEQIKKNFNAYFPKEDFNESY
jgi:serine/threonine protein kinase